MLECKTCDLLGEAIQLDVLPRRPWPLNLIIFLAPAIKKKKGKNKKKERKDCLNYMNVIIFKYLYSSQSLVSPNTYMVKRIAISKRI